MGRDTAPEWNRKEGESIYIYRYTRLDGNYLLMKMITIYLVIVLLITTLRSVWFPCVTPPPPPLPHPHPQCIGLPAKRVLCFGKSHSRVASETRVFLENYLSFFLPFFTTYPLISLREWISRYGFVVSLSNLERRFADKPTTVYSFAHTLWHS